MVRRYDKGDWVEDSTRGSSQIRPAKFKGDVVVQMWIDSRIVATLSNWLDSEGLYTRSMSEVGRDGLEVLTNHLVDAGKVELVDDTLEAREMLERKYRVNLNPSGRGLKNALHNKILTNERDGIKVRLDKRSMIDTPINRPSNISQGELDKMVEIYRGLEKKDVGKVEERVVDESEVIVQEEYSGFEHVPSDRVTGTNVHGQEPSCNEGVRKKSEGELDREDEVREKREREERKAMDDAVLDNVVEIEGEG